MLSILKNTLSLNPLGCVRCLATYVRSILQAIRSRYRAVTAPTCQLKVLDENSRRCGVIALKIGMMPVWDRWGTRIPCTIVQIENCQVTQIKNEPGKKMIHLQVGAGPIKLKNVTKPLLGHYKKAQVEPKMKLAEFPVTEDAILPVGTEITCQHFLPGQFINVQGYSIGKGFQGGMKRHGFAGLGASHGVSVSHRSIGSTGGRQDPGRVWKGQKMPGHMGNEKVTIQNLQVYKVEPERNLLYLRGSIPGKPGSYVKIFDSYKLNSGIPLPFPTYKPTKDMKLPLFAPSPATNPYPWM